MKRIKCGNADRYKALKAPKCGCDVCVLKFKIAEIERKYEPLFKMLEDAKDSANSAYAAASSALYVANYCR